MRKHALMLAAVAILWAAGHQVYGAPPASGGRPRVGSALEDDAPPVADRLLTDTPDRTGNLLEEIDGLGSGEAPELDDPFNFPAVWPLLESSGTWLGRGKVFVQSDVVMLTRATTDPVMLSSRAIAAGTLPVVSEAMTTDSTGFGYQPGMRATIGVLLGRDNRNRDHSIEFTYLGLTEWVAQHAVSVDPALTGLVLVPTENSLVAGFSGATEHNYRYWTNLSSYELNGRVRTRLERDRLVLKPDGQWQREITPGMEWGILGGFRLLSIDEEFRFGATDGAAGLVRGNYHVRTHNDLFGIQIGGDAREQHANWSAGVRTKAGVFANFADQTTHVDTFDAFLSGAPGVSAFRDQGASDDQLAVVAEVGLVGTYHFRPNVALRAAFDFMYIQGIAVAPEQVRFDASGGPRLRTGSFALLNGASVGLECFW